MAELQIPEGELVTTIITFPGAHGDYIAYWASNVIDQPRPEDIIIPALPPPGRKISEGQTHVFLQEDEIDFDFTPERVGFNIREFVALNRFRPFKGVGYVPAQNETEIFTPQGRKIISDAVRGLPRDIVPNVSPVVQSEHLATIGVSTVAGQAVVENNARFSPVLSNSGHARFVNIKVAPDVASNEIDFWGRQMSEHALFNFLGLEEPLLKQEALKAHLELEKFRTRFNKQPLDIVHMNTILPILERERMLQIEILETISRGEWAGWIFPLFENHITLELDYFVDKLNAKKYSPDQELVFWNRINSEHAGFAAHLLDPSERDLIMKAQAASDKFYNLGRDAITNAKQVPRSEKEMMLQLSLAASQQLDQFNKTAKANAKKIKHIIHPVLLEHVIREGERSIKTLNALGMNKESAAFSRQYEQQVRQYTMGK